MLYITLEGGCVVSVATEDAELRASLNSQGVFVVDLDVCEEGGGRVICLDADGNDTNITHDAEVGSVTVEDMSTFRVVKRENDSEE